MAGRFRDNPFAETTFGHQQLVAGGWQGKGSGVGRSVEGRSTYIAARRRQEGKGLGADRRERQDAMSDAFDAAWWDNLFNSAASKIKKRVSGTGDEEETSE